MYRFASVITVLFIVSCQSKSRMSIEQLKKADWLPLGKGVEYISTKERSSQAGDSVTFEFEGAAGFDENFQGQEYLYIKSYVEHFVNAAKGKKLDNSNQGYIRVNVREVVEPDTILISIYLRDHSKDSTAIAADLDFIRSYPEVLTTSYVSKEEAKKQFMEYEKKDFSEVLDENPLPSSIEVAVKTEKILQCMVR